MSVVDGRGRTIRLRPTPKPDPLAYYDTPDCTSFNDLVSTEVMQIVTDSKMPG